MINILEVTNKLLNKFYINVEQIKRNSDNTIEDIKQEAFIVVHLNQEKIKNNERVFINELKTRCLKFNKYGKRIESKERWERFNSYEDNMIKDEINNFNEEDEITLLTIKTLISEDDYNFLLCYFGCGIDFCCKKYNLSRYFINKKCNELLDIIKSKIL